MTPLAEIRTLLTSEGEMVTHVKEIKPGQGGKASLNGTSVTYEGVDDRSIQITDVPVLGSAGLFTYPGGEEVLEDEHTEETIGDLNGQVISSEEGASAVMITSDSRDVYIGFVPSLPKKGEVYPEGKF
ncbi:hypothetical protein A2115_03695 [Candidatus Woesebacteria bacterium GWA1_41_8]|uniref:Uncharacterized protein n=1 Tax=Candidatus Woesebacteria bacterium GWA1_41_8 TaxID=1802471 RepID=A0A1F7WIP3_9BACT|nr:MAG: hypothetical protein A2115_03695 [Candidatus Woesebacteria bacterium GWA1_41_8]